MDDKMNKQLRDILAFIAMVVIGGVLVALFGELAKHFIPSDTLYFSVINHVYLLAVATLLLWIGLGRIELIHIRNLTGFFLVLLILLAVAYEVDRIAIGTMADPSSLLISHVSAQYASLFLTILDGISLVLGAAGAFLLLWKGLDKFKDVLTGTTKSS